MVSPAGQLEVAIGLADGRALLEAIARRAEDELGPDPLRDKGELVMGLPLNMDGSEGPRAKLVRSFAVLLGTRTHRTVHLQDERLTSASADWTMSGSGLTHRQKKLRRDALAAAEILKDFLEGQADGSPVAGHRDPG